MKKIILLIGIVMILIIGCQEELPNNNIEIGNQARYTTTTGSRCCIIGSPEAYDKLTNKNFNTTNIEKENKSDCIGVIYNYSKCFDITGKNATLVYIGYKASVN